MNQIIQKPNHQIITEKDFPDWVNIGSGDWLKIDQLKQNELPSLEQIDQYLEEITTLANCSLREATVFAHELTDSLRFAKDDNRMESQRFIRLFTQMLTDYPFSVIDEAWDVLIKKTWFPELAEIEALLTKIDTPRRKAISQVATIRLKVARFKPTAQVIPLNQTKKDQIKPNLKEMK